MLLGRVREIVVLVDGKGVISYVSPSVHEWLGYEPDEAIGLEVLAATHRRCLPCLASMPNSVS